MDSLITMIANWKSTLVGLLTAIVIYEAGVGNKIPENKQEWAAFILGVLALALGLVTKDATTGSRPSMIVFALVPMLALSGCAGMFGLAGSAAQLKELVKDKNASCGKITGVYMAATITTKFTNIDRGTFPAGSEIEISDECGIKVKVAPAPPKPQ